jgi:hypothetical protein
MTVQELMEVLKNLDPDQDVNIWNDEYSECRFLKSVSVDEGELVLWSGWKGEE